MNELLEAAIATDYETEALDFKASFDSSSQRAWCEIVKDIVAMANSGGGVILIGLNDDGSPSAFDIEGLLNLDPADITNKIYKYTDYQFSEFDIVVTSKGEHRVMALVVRKVPVPIIFTSPGTYTIENNKQRTSFGQGTVYFRHGTKSEPGNMHDLRRFLERQLDCIRDSWLKGIRQVVEAPPGASIAVLPPEVREFGSPNAVAIRIVDDLDAPGYRQIDPNITHPHRQKDIIDKVNQKISGMKINQHHFQCIKSAFSIEQNPKFYYKLNYSSPRYSDAFIDWIMDQYQQDNQFFENARMLFRDNQKNTSLDK